MRLWKLEDIMASAVPGVPEVSLEIDWLPIILAIILAALGSSVLTALADRLLSRHHSRHDSAQQKADAVLEALGAFRLTMQTYESLQRSAGPVIDEDRDLKIAKSYNTLLIAVAATTSKSVMEATKNYNKVAEKFAAADPETGSEAEETEFFNLLDKITLFVRRNKN